MEQDSNKNKRRGFLKALLTIGAGVGLLSTVKASEKIIKREKVKMLTPDGKMVEVDKDVFERSNSSKVVSNKEVKEWMKK